jgi:hypothetical protein
MKSEDSFFYKNLVGSDCFSKEVGKENKLLKDHLKTRLLLPIEIALNVFGGSEMPVMAPTVDKYVAEWDAEKHSGKITVIVSGKWHTIELTNPSEFATIVDILRNEKPVFFKEKFHLLTHQEEVGEEES